VRICCPNGSAIMAGSSLTLRSLPSSRHRPGLYDPSNVGSLHSTSLTFKAPLTFSGVPLDPQRVHGYVNRSGLHELWETVQAVPHTSFGHLCTDEPAGGLSIGVHLDQWRDVCFTSLKSVRTPWMEATTNRRACWVRDLPRYCIW
jgi:hypothetical protein